MPTIAISLGEQLLSELDSRSTGDGRERDKQGRSSVLQQALGRYFEGLSRAQRALKRTLSEAEVSLILDATNGTMFSEPFSVAAIPDEVEDAIEFDGLAEKWGVDGSALIEKLRALDYLSLCALVDASERYWNRIGVVEQ